MCGSTHAGCHVPCQALAPALGQSMAWPSHCAHWAPGCDRWDTGRAACGAASCAPPHSCHTVRHWQRLSDDGVEDLALVLGHHTVTLGLEGFTCHGPQPAWQKLLNQFHLLQELQLRHGLEYAHLRQLAGAATRPLVLHLITYGSFSKQEATQLAASSSMLTVV